MIDPINEQISLYAKQLRLPTFTEFEDVIRQADPDLSYGGFLMEMMRRELEQRHEKQMKKRLENAAFPFEKTLDEFQMDHLNPSISPSFISELASCDFIKKHQNIIMIGPPGRGKTHLSIALGMKACRAGFKVLFKNAAALSTQLAEAQDTYKLEKLQKSLARADLLILDELSYISFNRHQSELLFQVISDRSEKKSTIVTTNLPFSKWTELFENDTMVSALVDRLTFHSHILDMNGVSYRLEQSKNN